jgi:ABC-2 family transporter
MIWLTWRQFRLQAASAAGAVVAIAIVLAITGPRLVDLSTTAGVNLFDQLTQSDRWLYNAGVVLMATAPAVVGAFWGAPLVARELESGTHQLVWNQSITRVRWLAAKLGAVALIGAATVGILSFAVTWWADPLDGTASATRGSLPARLTPVVFAMRGIAPVGYAVFAVVLGVAAGLVLRRTVPAMAVTLVIYTVVQIAMPLWVRPHLIPPEQRTIAISASALDGISFNGEDPTKTGVKLTLRSEPGAWVLANDTVDPAGQTLRTLPSWFSTCLPQPGVSRADGESDIGTCLTRLSDAGYQQHQIYQPADRFWPMQWAETGLFLAVSALLAGFSFWRIRRPLS